MLSCYFKYLLLLHDHKRGTMFSSCIPQSRKTQGKMRTHGQNQNLTVENEYGCLLLRPGHEAQHQIFIACIIICGC
jgi:hypothetical protein